MPMGQATTNNTEMRDFLVSAPRFNLLCSTLAFRYIPTCLFEE